MPSAPSPVKDFDSLLKAVHIQINPVLFIIIGDQRIAPGQQVTHGSPTSSPRITDTRGYRLDLLGKLGAGEIEERR